MITWLKKYRTRAAVLFVCAFLPMLMAPSGGFPSRPRFQSVGVNVAAPATGDFTASGTVTAGGAVTGTLTVSGAASVGGSSVLTLASGGNITVAPTIGGSGICRADGTTCPANTGFSSGNYTGTVVGCTTNPGPLVVWIKSGNMVSLQFSPFTCTSNAGTFTITGAPAAIRTTTANGNRQVVAACQNNSVQEFGTCTSYMSTGGVINIEYRGTTFTASGTKGIGLTAAVGMQYDVGW